MIERVAKALYDKQKDLYVTKQLEFKDTPHKHYWLSNARTAIEAMREPTNEMREAGSKYLGGEITEMRIGFVYQDMIDAALKE